VKFFEKYQKKIEFIIVNHEDFSCIEVIVLGVRLGNKATRLYLNSAILITKVDVEQFNVTLEIKQNSASRQNILFVPGFEMKKIALNMITTMLVDGIKITSSVFAGEFDVFFQMKQFDFNSAIRSTNNNIEFEFEIKPKTLIPFRFVSSLTDQLRFETLFFIEISTCYLKILF
jgi:hypothetical protein